MEPQPLKPTVRYYEIDLLRFLAALSVVFYHYTFHGHTRSATINPYAFPEISWLTRYGYLGVDLFFIISGYVVLLSAQGKTVRQFFTSRVIRLYPAYWVACTLTAVVGAIWGPGAGETQMSALLKPNVLHYVANMTMLNGFLNVPNVDNAYWSLVVEMTFYFLISLVISYKLMRHINLLILIWLGYVVVYQMLVHFIPAQAGTGFYLLFFPKYAPLFAAGMLFYLLQRAARKTWTTYALLLLAYGLAVFEAVGSTQKIAIHWNMPFNPLVTAALVTVFFGFFFLITFQKLNMSRHSWLAWLGALTYPLYLMHTNIGFIIFHRLGHFVNKYVMLFGTILFIMAISYAVHVLIERRYSRPLGTKVNQLFTYLDRYVSQEPITPAAVSKPVSPIPVASVEN
ncbi:acyltransferase family protein [Hymenobacter sp. IS2118]|uniref:acyltransferase family protein n=1 Tax=Hymenobacter sp. IS2118 TaxID=1505605 RepID=UPI001378020C|nr:acyltransferase [Hymenobacter sp. IS2118]